MTLDRRRFLAVSGAAAPTLLAASTQTHCSNDSVSPKRYRAAIIAEGRGNGYGHHHHLVFSRREDVEVVALADPYEDVRDERAAEAGVQRVYDDYREMLEAEKPDIVSVAPRHLDKRVEHLLACIEHDCHGYVEKPFCMDLHEADQIIQALDEKPHLKWMISHNFRATHIIQQVKQIVFDEEFIGDVLEVRGRGKEDHRAGGEDLIVLGSHIFDMMRFFMGDPQWCCADIVNQDGSPVTPMDVLDATEPIGPVVGERIHALYGFSGGRYASFASQRNAHGDGGRWGLDIFGSRGVVTIRIDYIPHVHWLRDSSWAPGMSGERWDDLIDSPGDVFNEPHIDSNALLIDQLIAAIEEDIEPALSVRTSGIGSVEMFQAANESLVQGGRVEFPLANRSHPLRRWTQAS